MSFSQVSHVDNVSVPCIPWYFPTPVNVPVYFCNPWETVRFLEFMHNVPEGQCHCLPDCNATFYEPDITSALLRKCDSSNFGVSWLCNANNRLEPSMYGGEIKDLVRDEYFDNGLYKNIFKMFEESDRFIMDSFGQRNYNPFDKDIALLEVFFKKPSIIQISRQARMSWIDYLSTVGGLLGLVLGMGIVSFIELLWLCLRIAALKMNFQNLVP